MKAYLFSQEASLPPTCSSKMALPPLAKFILQAERVCLLQSTLSGREQPAWNSATERQQSPSHGRLLPVEAICIEKILSQEVMRGKERRSGRGPKEWGWTQVLQDGNADHRASVCQTHPSPVQARRVCPSYLATALS